MIRAAVTFLPRWISRIWVGMAYRVVKCPPLVPRHDEDINSWTEAV